MSDKAFSAADRGKLISGELGATVMVRKTARIVATRVLEPFTVMTEHGEMRAEAGDWLVTNHPDDDPGSDLWPISDERMRATYRVAEEPLP